MITTCLVASFIHCLLPNVREACLFVLPEKKIVIVARWISRARELSVNPVSLLRPFIADKAKLSEPHLIRGSYVDPPLESEKNRSLCCMQKRSCLVCYSSSAEYQGERGLICSSIPSILTDC